MAVEDLLLLGVWLVEAVILVIVYWKQRQEDRRHIAELTFPLPRLVLHCLDAKLNEAGIWPDLGDPISGTFGPFFGINWAPPRLAMAQLLGDLGWDGSEAIRLGWPGWPWTEQIQ